MNRDKYYLPTSSETMERVAREAAFMRLRDAAPALLAACKGLAEVHRAHGFVEAGNGWWTELDAAIAQAEPASPDAPPAASKPE